MAVPKLCVPKLQFLRSRICCRLEFFAHLAFTTSTVQILRVRQDLDGSQDKQIYHSMVPGLDLERYATGHEMLNQQSEKQRFPKTPHNWIAELYLGLTQILCQLVDFLGKSKRNFNPGPLNWNDPLGCQPSKQSKPSRKPLQPTHWECHSMIAFAF